MKKSWCSRFTTKLRGKDSNVLGDFKITREKEADFLNYQVEGRTYKSQMTVMIDSFLMNASCIVLLLIHTTVYKDV